uniref:Uncharacterized protein orf91 n=1 Tax=Staurastrum punctulatum TaxID=102822 RepID=Q32RR4_STAPU|nr:hypothetical protein StpuCp099 [Staurastrum punctulatum]AAX45775.1 hypothetical protein [Staurastrum punctulatum]
MIRRAIEPATQLQTGFWIYGTAGIEKSTMVSWIASIVVDPCAEMYGKNCTLFPNARLKGKYLMNASDVDVMTPEAERLCKTILGRDRIPSD